MKSSQLVVLLVSSVVSTNAFSLDAKFADKAWNGKKVPDGQQCLRFGGKNPSTPKLIVSDIPKHTDKIVLEYSDRDSERMNHGGHGRMSFTLSSPKTTVEIPSIPGHTFDIPAPFKIIEAQRAPGWDKAGAYMPPCSGGRGHEYYVTIKAVSGDKVTATTVLQMGKY